MRIEIGDDLVRERVPVLDERDRARERAPVAAPNACGESLACPVAAPGHQAMLVDDLDGRSLGGSGCFVLRVARERVAEACRSEQHDPRRPATPSARRQPA